MNDLYGKKYKIRRLLGIVLLIVPLSILSIGSLVPGVTNEMFDSIHFPITNDRLWVPNSNIYSDDFGDEFVVFEYRTYNEYFNGFRRYFQVRNHDDLINYLDDINMLEKQYVINENNQLFVLNKNDQYFYLLYNEVDLEYYLTPATVYFNNSSESDQMPLLPCDFFLEEDFYTLDDEITVYTTLTWNEVKEFYLTIDDNINVNNTETSLELFNPLTNNTYIITFDNHSLIISLDN